MSFKFWIIISSCVLVSAFKTALCRGNGSVLTFLDTVRNSRTIASDITLHFRFESKSEKTSGASNISIIEFKLATIFFLDNAVRQFSALLGEAR